MFYAKEYKYLGHFSSLMKTMCGGVGGGGWGRELFSLLSLTKNVHFGPYLAVEEAQQMYQLRKVALEAKRNKPDLNYHYTKIKVTPKSTSLMLCMLHACIHNTHMAWGYPVAGSMHSLYSPVGHSV